MTHSALLFRKKPTPGTSEPPQCTRGLLNLKNDSQSLTPQYHQSLAHWCRQPWFRPQSSPLLLRWLELVLILNCLLPSLTIQALNQKQGYLCVAESGVFSVLQFGGIAEGLFGSAVTSPVDAIRAEETAVQAEVRLETPCMFICLFWPLSCPATAPVTP